MIPIQLQHYSGVLGTYNQGDWIAGVNSPIIPEKRNVTGDWRLYKPEHELQFINAGTDTPFETSFCVAFSACDSIETEMNYLLANGLIPNEYVKWLNDNGYFKNGIVNFSDRFAGILGETTTKGAYVWKVANAIEKYGLIPESMLPNDVSTYQEFTDGTKITEEMYEMGRQFKKRFYVNYEWITYDGNPISKELLKDSLQVSPMQCVVRYDDGEGVLNPTGQLNHAVLCNGYEEDGEVVDINDSYWREQKLYSRQHPRNYIQYYITINKIESMDKAKFYKQNDKKWVRNVNTGAFGKVLQGKLYVADTKDRMVLMLVDEAHRNNGVSITDVEWQLLDKATF